MGEHHARAMPLAMAERALDLAADHATTTTEGMLDVGFFGGEPLLAWGTLVAIAKRAREKRGLVTRLQVTTNGTLIDDERARVLADLGVRTTISIDGAAAAHDRARPNAKGRSSHAAVLRGVESLAHAGLLEDLLLVVSRANVRTLRSDIAYLRGLRPRAIHVNVAYETAFTDDELVAWETELRGVAEDFVTSYGTEDAPRFPLFETKIAAIVNGGLTGDDGCSVGRSNVAVAPSGRLFPCDRLVGEDGPREAPRVIGHLDDGIAPTRSLPRGTAAPECATCEERPRCGSHCACANAAETGATNMPGPVQCWHEQVVAALADDVAEALLNGKNVRFSQWLRGTHIVGAREETKRRLPQVPS